MRAVSVFIFCACVLYISAYTLPKTRLSIEGYGRDIEGVIETTAWTKKTFLTFHDLRYAQPPVGRLRFKAPQPLEEEQELHSTTDYGGCPSIQNLDAIKQAIEATTDEEDLDYLEDCLKLTVSTKSRFERYPVIVHLAGYDLEQSENAEAKPAFFLEKDVVLVSVQYRTGILGFLSTNSEEVPGNVAVLDVIQALRWVKEYISRFGGDKDNITLMGQYGAAALIHILTMTEAIDSSEQLFHKVVLQSGSALMSGMVTDNHVDMAKQIAKKLRCPMRRSHQINKCLRNKDLYELLSEYAQFHRENPHYGYFIVGGESKVLPDWPAKLLEEGKYKNYPTMGGAVMHPAMGLEELNLDNKGFSDNFGEIKDIFISTIHDEKRRDMQEKSFPKSLLSRVIYRAMWPGKVDLVSLDIKESVAKALKYNAVNASDEEATESYLYAFNYEGEYGNLDYTENGVIGLTDDNVYLFPSAGEELLRLNKKDTTLAKTWVEIFSSFAQNGRPNAGDGVQWPPMLKGHLGPYMKIDGVCEVGWNYAEQFFVTILGMLHKTK